MALLPRNELVQIADGLKKNVYDNYYQLRLLFHSVLYANLSL